MLVAETPLGYDPQTVDSSNNLSINKDANQRNADAPLGEQFVQPCTSTLLFTDFMAKLTSGEESGVCYMQSQNNNLPNEFPKLVEDIDKELAWASEAFGKYHY